MFNIQFSRGQKPWFVAFADFHGISTPTSYQFTSLEEVGKRCSVARHAAIDGKPQDIIIKYRKRIRK